MSATAQTIAAQMGGTNRLRAMLGANVYANADGDGLSIAWPNRQRSKGNYVEVRLMPSDTYRMEFFNATMASHKSVAIFDDVYADQLVRIFEDQTGWRLGGLEVRGLA